MTSYCEYLHEHPEDTLNKLYHDNEYGFPLLEEAALLERFAHEINQAGLSWTLILKRKEYFHRAFEGFDVDKVAAYREQDVARLLAEEEQAERRKDRQYWDPLRRELEQLRKIRGTRR